MDIIENKSAIHSATRITDDAVQITNKQSPTYPEGTNKTAEYDWFYLVALKGQAGHPITIHANYDPQTPPQFARNNSLVYFSANGYQWQQLDQPVQTDVTGLKQRYIWTPPDEKSYLLSNTIFFPFSFIDQQVKQFVAAHSDLCKIHSIGQSIEGRDLNIITFRSSSKPKGRILITTGCHPAEPDFICSQAIMDFLVTTEATPILRNYEIDVLPLQNPDGAANYSNLTAKGINLYWNFRKDDQKDCPEAYHLWQHIKANPPILHLDFHAYVHQYHRHPMPYLQGLDRYTGRYTKNLVKQMDRALIKLSQGYYRIGTLSMWPDALSTYITDSFNTIAYTKYHINLFEGIPRSRQRAADIFRSLTTIASNNEATTNKTLTKPTGSVTLDTSDSTFNRTLLHLRARLMQATVYIKAYARYYRMRSS